MPAALIYRRQMNGQNGLPYAAWLQALDMPIVLFTLNEEAGDDRFSHVERFQSFDAQGGAEERALELARRFRFTHVFAQSEHDILRAAVLRETLGIDGQGYDSALAYRDKVYMKSLAQVGSVDCAPFAAVSSPDEIKAFVLSYGLPCVLKPRRGAGARGVHVLRTDADVRRFTKQPILPDLMIESFVLGSMFHVDALVVKGELAFSSSSRYVKDNLSYQNGDSTGSVLIDPLSALSSRLVAVTRQTILALPPAPVMAIHAEFFLDSSDRVLLCEIACRPGGSRTADPIEAAYGFNMYEHWVKLSFGLPVSSPDPRPWFSAGRLLVPPRRGRLRSMPASAPFDWVIDYRQNSARDQWWNDPDFSGAHIASFVLSGRHAQETEERLLTLDRWFRDQLVWE